MPSQGADKVGDPPLFPDRWERAWELREDLLRLARSRTANPDDAEDAVSEAIVRAATDPRIDDDRLANWLTSVTLRLCVDSHRRRRREAAIGDRIRTRDDTRLEDEVCDRHAADWAARQAEHLPPRQAAALRLRAEGLDVSQVSERLGVSYRTAESLLARARRTVRAALAGALGALAWLWRKPVSQLLPAKSLVPVALVLAVELLTLPGLALRTTQPLEPRLPGPRSVGTPSVPAVVPDRVAGRDPGASGTPTGRTGEPAAARRTVHGPAHRIRHGAPPPALPVAVPPPLSERVRVPRLPEEVPVPDRGRPLGVADPLGL